MAFIVLLLSMIVNNLHLEWTIFPPLDADTPLLVYAYALLGSPVSPQRFKAITGKVHQIFHTGSVVKVSVIAAQPAGQRTENGKLFYHGRVFRYACMQMIESFFLIYILLRFTSSVNKNNPTTLSHLSHPPSPMTYPFPVPVWSQFLIGWPHWKTDRSRALTKEYGLIRRAFRAALQPTGLCEL